MCLRFSLGKAQVQRTQPEPKKTINPKLQELQNLLEHFLEKPKPSEPNQNPKNQIILKLQEH